MTTFLMVCMILLFILNVATMIWLSDRISDLEWTLEEFRRRQHKQNAKTDARIW